MTSKYSYCLAVQHTHCRSLSTLKLLTLVDYDPSAACFYFKRFNCRFLMKPEENVDMISERARRMTFSSSIHFRSICPFTMNDVVHVDTLILIILLFISTREVNKTILVVSNRKTSQVLAQKGQLVVSKMMRYNQSKLEYPDRCLLHIIESTVSEKEHSVVDLSHYGFTNFDS